MINQKRLDKLANLWNKTKNPKYKKLWYRTIKETYGPNNIERWSISVSSVNKADDGTYVVIGKRN